MARADRLLRLTQALRTHRPPVTAATLAVATGVSQRTLYRDIDALRAAGALIDGEAGVGYRLIEDPALPPQSFDRLEIEALVIGLSEVRQIGDTALAAAAENALAKIAATLPDRQQRQILHAISLVHHYGDRARPGGPVPVLRDAAWEERAVRIAYADREDRATERTILPLAIAFVEGEVVCLSWCCLRQDFRMFRTDRIREATPDGPSFRPRRAALLSDYLSRLHARR